MVKVKFPSHRETMGHAPLWQCTNCRKVLLTDFCLFHGYIILINKDRTLTWVRIWRERWQVWASLPLLGELSSSFCRVTWLVQKIQYPCRGTQTDIRVRNRHGRWFADYILIIYIADKTMEGGELYSVSHNFLPIYIFFNSFLWFMYICFVCVECCNYGGKSKI